MRGSSLVHGDTRLRVEAEMQRQGYIYNRVAATLRNRMSSAVALVINDISNPFFSEFAAGVDEYLGKMGYVTLLGNSNESTERQCKVLNSLIEHHPAGIILSPAENSSVDDMRDVAKSNIPLVVFNRALSEVEGVDLRYDFLCLDNRGGARQATEYLIRLGHRRIAFYGGHENSSSCKERRLGYQDALKIAGIGVNNDLMLQTAPTKLDAIKNSDKLFSLSTVPTAAVCYNDAVALGLMAGLLGKGLKPGDDFSVIGFDGIPEAAFSIPPLTTICTDPRTSGKRAAEQLMARINQPDAINKLIVIPVEFTQRFSAAHPPVAM